MLQLNCHRFSQLALWFTPKPEYGTDSITVLWEHVVFLSTFTSLAASVAGYWFTQKYSIRSHFWSESLHFEKKLPSLMLFFLSYTVSIGTHDHPWHLSILLVSLEHCRCSSPVILPATSWLETERSCHQWGRRQKDQAQKGTYWHALCYRYS